MKRAALILSALILLGCQSSSDGGASSAPARASGGSRVVVIVMENKEYGDVIGSQSSPYVNALARRYALATRSYGIRHPSLPNYFALTAGTTFGVQTNCVGCQQSGESIADQLDASRLSWKAYMGGMPRACFKGAFSGRYAKKHDPFMYYKSVAGNPSRCARVVPGGQLAADVRGGRLPKYVFVSPDLCDDSHDCSVSSGDSYLARTVPPLLKALGPRGFLVLTWDEGVSNAGCCGGLANGGRIPMVIAGPQVKRAARIATPVTHYSTLRTIEDAFGLPRLRNAGSSQTASLDGAFKSPPRLR